MLMPELRLGSHTARRPIVQGGMGVGISLSGLASAVAENGGVGVISTVGIGMHEPDIRKNYVAANCRALVTRCWSTSLITMPGRRPWLAAVEPGTTLVITTPLSALTPSLSASCSSIV